MEAEGRREEGVGGEMTEEEEETTTEEDEEMTEEVAREAGPRMAVGPKTAVAAAAAPRT